MFEFIVVGFFFVCVLYFVCGMLVGLIYSLWGGMFVEVWISCEGVLCILEVVGSVV